MPVSAIASDFRPRRTSRWVLAALVILGCAGAFALAQRRSPFAKPRLVGTTNAMPLAIQHANGAWYWREKTKNAGERLMRISESGSQEIAKADTLSCYALSEGKLAWVERKGQEWTISLAESDGSNPRSLWKSGDEPMGIALAQGRIYWLQRLPAPVANAGHFPSLSPSLQVASMPMSGEGKPDFAARLWESEDGEILGLQGNALVVAIYRHTLPGSFCVYRVPLGQEAPVRLVGERGLTHPLLTRKGVLYWTTLSKESAGPPASVCLRRLDPNGQSKMLSDWLPFSGDLYETERGVLYKDNEIDSALWSEGQHDVFPEPLPLPPGYAAVAAGEGRVLLAPAMTDVAHSNLYEMSLP